MLSRHLNRLLVATVLLLLSCSLNAQSLNDLEKKKSAAEKEIAYINSLLSKTGSQKTSALQQLTLLQSKVKYRRDLVNNTQLQIGVVANEMTELKKNVTSLRTELDNLKRAYAEILSVMYMKRRNATWLMYILASDDVAQGYRRLKYFQSFADMAVSKAEQIKHSTQDLQTSIAELEVKKNELTVFQKAKQVELSSLAKEEAEYKSLKDDIEKKERTLRTSLTQQQKLLQSINTEIDKVMKAEASKIAGNSSSKPTSSGSDELPAAVKELSTKFEANRGKLPWPLKKGVVTDKFGPRKHPVFTSLKLPPNNGIDISTDANADVVSIFSGQVAKIFPIAGYGNCMIISHGEYLSLYCRLKSIAVKAGDKVKIGDAIAKVDKSAEGTSVLHFELWKGSTILNPELWLLAK